MSQIGNVKQSEIKFADNYVFKLAQHNFCSWNCVFGTKIFPKPAVFAAVIVFTEY